MRHTELEATLETYITLLVEIARLVLSILDKLRRIGSVVDYRSFLVNWIIQLVKDAWFALRGIGFDLPEDPPV